MDDGDDRIAAGGRVVGEQHHRVAVGRHLNRARGRGLRWEGRRVIRRPSRTPDKRTPTRLDSVTVHTLTTKRSKLTGSNQSSRGPGPTLAVSRGRRVGAWSTASCDSGSGPIDSTSPVLSGAGPSPDNVSVDRELNTAGTSIPPRTAT